jgi:membrane protease subunit (stomatin/prohibitin family)
MGLFGNKTEGGLMDVIRCDEEQYLIWKWRPKGASLYESKKENSIRYGSSIRVKEGEVAVFVYKQPNGTLQDFIEGPYDGTIQTANFPILTSIVGAAFGGNSPFQAEIYYINLQGNNQLRFGVPYFNVFDPRDIDFSAPVAARGTITFNITSYKSFIKLNRMIDFDLDSFYGQIKDAVTKYAKAYITNAPTDFQLAVLQLERKILDVSNQIQLRLNDDLANDFGVNLKRFDLSVLEFDKESEDYKRLVKRFGEQSLKMAEGTTTINLENLSETMRITRKDLELGVEGKNFAVHQLNQQTDVLKTAAESLGDMGSVSLGGGGGLNPVGLMTGMAIGNVMGNQMGGMMNNMGKQPTNTPPPPTTLYHIALNGQQSGPFTIEQLKQFVSVTQFTKLHHVWKDGMSGWELADKIDELLPLFGSIPPPLTTQP